MITFSFISFESSLEGALEVPFKEMACVVMQHVAVAPKIPITLGLQPFFWESEGCVHYINRHFALN